MSASSRVYLGVDGDAISLMATEAVGDAGGEARVASLFDAHHQRLYRLARRLSASADEARDLVQETFLRVARRPQAVPGSAPADEAWLVRVLVNIARDGWRRRAVQRDYRERQAAADVQRSVPSPEAAVIARRTVWAALLQLDPRRRAVIVLHELEGAAVADIARVLGVTAVTVRWHLSRGRRELAGIVERKALQ